jgi:O-antigen ligase
MRLHLAADIGPPRWAFLAVAGLSLILACACVAPTLYWRLLGMLVVVAVGFLAIQHVTAFCVAWLLVTSMTIEMTLYDLVGDYAFQASIAVIKGGGVLLAVLCALRYGPRLDVLNPSWAFVSIMASGLMHGLFPGLTVMDSARSLIGSAAPFVFGFARVSRAWAQAMIRATIWCPSIAAAAGALFAFLGLRPLFVDSGGLRLAALGHPAFLAGVCLPAIYAGLTELWRDGRRPDGVMLGVNFVILVLTGARAPLAYALFVSGITFLCVRSRAVPFGPRFLVVVGVGLLLPPMALLAGDLSSIRLFNVLSNETGNLSGRDVLWPVFEAVIAESPWVGWGLGAGNLVIPPSSRIAQTLHTWAAHNEYLRMEVEGGQVGLAILVFLTAAWAICHSARLSPVERPIIRLVFIAFAAHAFTDNVLISTPACVLFTFLTAVFARGRHERVRPSALPGAG